MTNKRVELKFNRRLDRRPLRVVVGEVGGGCVGVGIDVTGGGVSEGVSLGELAK